MTDNFRAINYTLEANNQGDDLNLTLKENTTKSYLKFGCIMTACLRVLF
jgi:NTE family protein